MSGAHAGRPATLSGWHLLLFFVAILLVSLNLRPAITGIPPIIDIVSADLGVGPAMAGMLTALPVLCFALVGPLVALATNRFDVDRVLLASMALLAIAVAVRPWGGWWLLVAGTAGVGAAITVGNVLVPVLVRRDAPRHAGVLMPLTTAGLSTGAAAASAVVVASERWIGWRPTLALVAVPVLVALAVGIARIRLVPRGGGGRAVAADGTGRVGEGGGGTGARAAGEAGPAADSAGNAASAAGSAGGTDLAGGPAGTTAPAGHLAGGGGGGEEDDGTAAGWSPRPSPWTQGSAWWLALYFGSQSTLFYAVAAWLPLLVADRADVSRDAAGLAATLYYLIGIGGSLATPLLVRWLGSYRRLAPVPGVLWLLSLLGLLFLPSGWVAWSVVAGVGQGIGIGVALTLVALRPVNADYGRSLSAMAQSAGYALAALGPVVVGALYGSSGTWVAAILVLAALAVVEMVSGWPAGAPRHIGLRPGEPEPPPAPGLRPT